MTCAFEESQLMRSNFDFLDRPSPKSRDLPIVDLPDVVLENVFSFLPYDAIAKNRLVCKRFNDVGGRMLSRAFFQLEKRHALIHRRVKSVLPRRESERRVHPMAAHVDVLQALETRMSMLKMTYIKYVKSNALCFIPGKVLDEIKKILNMVDSNAILPRTHELLQELRDLSSMALEHFDEHILPRLTEHKEHLDGRRQAPFLSLPGRAANLKPPTLITYPAANELKQIRKQHVVNRRDISLVQLRTQRLLQKVKSQTVKIREQDHRMREQAAKIQEQESALCDIKRQLDDWDQKFKDLNAELVRARNDLVRVSVQRPPLKPSTSMVIPDRDVGPMAAKLFKGAAKSPKKPTQLLPQSYELLDVERKRKSNLLPEIPVKMQRYQSGVVKKPKERKDKILGTLIQNYIKGPLANMGGNRKRKITQALDFG